MGIVKITIVMCVLATGIFSIWRGHEIKANLTSLVKTALNDRLSHLGDQLMLYRASPYLSCSDMGMRSFFHNSSVYDDSCGPDRLNCLKTSLPDTLTDRIESLLHPGNMTMPQHFEDVIREMGNEVKGQYDVIIASALSSSYYEEAQGMLKSFHTKVFPELRPMSFALVIYDLGLTMEQRMRFQQHCKCRYFQISFFVEHCKCRY